MRFLTRIHVIISTKMMGFSFILTSSANMSFKISHKKNYGIWFLANVAHLDNWKAIYLCLKPFMHWNHVFIKMNMISTCWTMLKTIWMSKISSNIYFIFKNMRFPSQIWSMWNGSMRMSFEIYGVHFTNLRGCKGIFVIKDFKI